jgi:hypothetical protein
MPGRLLEGKHTGVSCMLRITFTLFMTLILLANTGFAQNLCSGFFSPSVASSLKEMDSQKALRTSWETLFKSDDLASYDNLSDKDVGFFGAHSEQLTKNLTPEVQEALQSYTELSGGYGGEYESVNIYLRKYVKDRPLSNRSAVAAKAKLIEKGIQQAPTLPEGLLLFRGLAINPSSINVGEKFKDFGFISTTLEPSVAYQFAQVSARNGETPHLFIIEVKSKDVQGLPLAKTNEKEILLQRGLEMQVQKIVERTMRVRSPGLHFDRTIEVPFRIVYLTVDDMAHNQKK